MSGDVESFADRLCAELPYARTNLICGGELTVSCLGAAGLGGRCQHLALLLSLRLYETNQNDWMVLCCGTDGSDGPTIAAGAIGSSLAIEFCRAARDEPTTICDELRMSLRARAIALNSPLLTRTPEQFACDFDSFHFWQHLDALTHEILSFQHQIITGSTGTNVCDLCITVRIFPKCELP